MVHKPQATSSVTEVIFIASLTIDFLKLGGLYSFIHGAWQMRGLFLWSLRKVNKKNKLFFSVGLNLLHVHPPLQGMVADKKLEYIHLQQRELLVDRIKKKKKPSTQQ